MCFPEGSLQSPLQSRPMVFSKVTISLSLYIYMYTVYICIACIHILQEYLMTNEIIEVNLYANTDPPSDITIDNIRQFSRQMLSLLIGLGGLCKQNENVDFATPWEMNAIALAKITLW